MSPSHCGIIEAITSVSPSHCGIIEAITSVSSSHCGIIEAIKCLLYTVGVLRL